MKVTITHAKVTSVIEQVYEERGVDAKTPQDQPSQPSERSPYKRRSKISSKSKSTSQGSQLVPTEWEAGDLQGKVVRPEPSAVQGRRLQRDSKNSLE